VVGSLLAHRPGRSLRLPRDRRGERPHTTASPLGTVGTILGPGWGHAIRPITAGRAIKRAASRIPREIAGHANARAQLFAMLRAYIQHGVENPALYKLMFGDYLSSPNDGRPAIERAAAENTKALLAGVIVKGGLGRAIPNTARNERKIAGAFLACWSLLHGLTMLLADGLVGPRKISDELADSLVRGMLDGLATKLPALPPGTWIGSSNDQSSSE